LSSDGRVDNALNRSIHIDVTLASSGIGCVDQAARILKNENARQDANYFGTNWTAPKLVAD